MTDTQQIIDGIIRVGEANAKQFRADPNGDHPVCKNALGTMTCERCGRDVRGATGACPAVPREQRWMIDYPA